MSTLHIYSIDRHPDDAALKSGSTRSCHPEYIKEIIFRFGLSCVYPQAESLAIGMAHAQGEGIIEGVKVLFYVDWNESMTAWGMWTRQDNDADHEWFGRIFSGLSDVFAAHTKEKKRIHQPDSPPETK